jgi:hypothetical protein
MLQRCNVQFYEVQLHGMHGVLQLCLTGATSHIKAVRYVYKR